MLLVKNGEVKMKANTHSTRITLEWRGLEYDIAEWIVCKNWTRSGQWITTHRLELMNLDLRRATSMDDFIWSETWTAEEVWLDPTRVNESERDKWNAIIGRWETEGGGNRRGAVATARRETYPAVRSLPKLPLPLRPDAEYLIVGLLVRPVCHQAQSLVVALRLEGPLFMLFMQ